MPTLEECIRYQEELIINLKTSEKNYKKSPKERIKQPYLETRLEVLEQQFKEFQNGHKAISKASKDRTEEYFTSETYEEFEELYVNYKTVLREALKSFVQPSAQLSPPIRDMANENGTCDVKLPRMILPTFSGKYEEWQTFHDMFSSLIHTKTNITAVQKMHYLKSNLFGEALSLLSNFSTTEANYDDAWKQLVRRYDNKRYNCNAVMRSLFSIKKIHTESANAVRHLLDTTSTCLKSLENMGISTSSWDAVIVYMVITKLDAESIKQWEQHLNMLGDDLPTWDQLREFLEHRFRSLEMIDTNTSHPWQPAKPVAKVKMFHTAIENNAKTRDIECGMCHETHQIYHCNEFGSMTPKERQDYVQNNRLCFNCLMPTHSVINCRQSSSCRKCGRRHHTLLHFERDINQEARATSEVAASSASPSVPLHEKPSTSRGDITAAFARGALQPNRVLLATARVKVPNYTGCKQTIRALIDQGSMASFISESTVQLLGLNRTSVSGSVSMLEENRVKVKHMVSFRVVSRHDPASFVNVDAYVLHSLTALLPAAKLSVPEWTDIEDLPLADPTYTTPGKVEIILGAEVHAEILLEGLIKRRAEGSKGTMIAQNTMLGWIVSGRALRGPMTDESARYNCMHIHIQEDDFLKRFWEMENEPNLIQKQMTKSEKQCEEFFNSTTERDDDGILIVRLPFSTEDPKCQYSNSKDIAIKRLEILERKLLREPKLREEYNKVMEEYLSLNHMREVSERELENPRAVYLAHHAVVREDKETTKVRIVFDASSKGDNNVSLNDELLVGPKLQQDLRHILMRVRRHKICLVGDIIKMYRMVRVAEEDTDFQRIVWRFKSDGTEPIKHYKLLRLTFGTACAPYLAVKSLQRLAELEQDKYPLAAKITKQDFYMDDLITGAETETEALKVFHEMNELMRSGGFELQKWNSNAKRLMEKIVGSKELDDQSVHLKLNKTIKVLGVSWNRDTDSFEYTLNLSVAKEPITKRKVLSDVARLYDPLGWIAPVVVVAKILIQKLWKSGLEWDSPLTDELLCEWLTFRDNLVDLKQLKIPRWLSARPSSKIELHVFSDASRSAFAAAVYARVIDEKEGVNVHLVTAKTRVAPTEREISIPRLELCAAALAAKLIFEVAQVMEVPKEDLYGWTDSTIVLAWLKGGSARWTTFVSNRVSTILSILEFEQWSHVPTEYNAADCASRGLQPTELLEHPLWWSGPQWLSQPDLERTHTVIEDTHEEERMTSLTVLSHVEEEASILSRFSSLSRLLQVISYCRRVLNLKLPKPKRVNLPNFITAEELDKTLLSCINNVQEQEFAQEIKQLKSRGVVSKKSNLRTLCPFLDEKGTLRVSGRITQSDASYDMRHPVIMPGKNHFTTLLIRDAHHRTLHGGPQVMVSFLRSKYWILQAKDRTKKIYRECVTCLRYSRKKSIPLMGLLPEARVKPSKPFKSTGVDYCGPINIRFSPGRGAKSYKGYICLFVCMVTRAIHLEAVTDLTAKGFIAAFRRFTSRRGHCQDLYSDNGTNFTGADREMRDMFNTAKSSLPDEIAALLTLEHTTWHFIPPHAPNFGGLWEAGVRSTKGHLRKVIGNSTLTYEEMATALAQCEACLNSRPLSVLSDDPNDPLPLTPGHFLVGEPLLNIADDYNPECNVIGLDRWRLTQKIVSDFWKRWYKEYLVTLNQRYKWNTNCTTEPEVNDVVVLKEDNIPPAKWILGKIVQKHPGPDNITRVVSVKCKSGIFKRPVTKVCVITK